MTQAETKRVAKKKKKKQKKYNSTTGQCSFVSSFKSKIVDRLESEIVDNFWRPEIFARTCQYCLKKKKIYICISFVIVS